MLNRVVDLTLKAKAAIRAHESRTAVFDYVLQLRILAWEGSLLSPDADDDAPILQGHAQKVGGWTLKRCGSGA